MKAMELGKVADVFNGKTPSKAEQRDSGHPVLKVKDLTPRGAFVGTFDSYVDAELAGKFRAKWARQGDTVILNAAHNASHVASKAALLQQDVEGSLLTGEWLIVRPDNAKVDARYIHYWLTWPVVRTAMKAAVKGIHLYPKDVAALRVPIPALTEQRRIAAILDHADALRAKRRQVLTHLEAMTQSIFNDMFGDPDESRDNVDFGSLANLAGGRNLVAADSASDTPYRVLKISAVTTGQFKPHESKPLPPDYVPPVDHLVRAGDLLMSRANTTELVGAVAYVSATPPNLALPDKVWRFQWKVEAEPAFYQALFSTPAIRRRISRLSGGTGGSMKNVSKAKLETMPLPRVAVERQRDFVARAQRVTEHRGVLQGVAVADNELFASLQARAFRGEL